MKVPIYNTVDDVPVIQSVEKIVDLVLSKPELTWAALIDTAFDYGRGNGSQDSGLVVNCFDLPELQGLKAVGPCLVALLPQSDLRMQVARLIRHCQGRPMLSFVGAFESLNDISKKWSAIHMVSVVDKQKMLLRFSDTRILSYLPQVLTAQQWGAICGAVSIWTYFDRAGRLISCDIPDSKDRPKTVSVTKEQLEKLLDASHPDALIALIAESMCDIVPMESSASERYRMISESCDLARKYDVKDNADVLALAVAAYLTEGRCAIDNRLESLLQQKSWLAGTLGDAIVDAEMV